MTFRTGHRTLPVRAWFALAAITTFVLVVVVVLASVQLFGVADRSSQDRLDDASAQLERSVARWRDPAWQAEAAKDLARDDVDFVLLDDGEVIHRSTSENERPGDFATRLLEVASAPTHTARVSTPLRDDNPMSGVLRATLFIGLVAAAVSIAFGRPFVRSLRAIRQAARRVAVGDLAGTLPPSRITELDEVNDAFDQMTTELDHALAQQAELEQGRRLFISAIAHDLRTPLFSLRGYLEGLEAEVADSPEKRARYLAIASAKAQTLDRLVADLFEYTRLEYLDQALQVEPLDLVELLSDLLEGLRPQADAKDLRLVLLPHEHSIPVRADREQLVRAVTNLVDNAIRHSPAGGYVDLSCGCDPEAAWFSVKDSGPGVRPEDLPHLFHPLYRGGVDQGAAGLGLATAQRILEAHGGSLEVANAATVGAVFTGHLPADSAGFSREGDGGLAERLGDRRV